MFELVNTFLSLPRFLKRAIAVISDIALCFICTWIAYVLRFEELILFKDFNLFAAFLSIVVAFPIFWLFGLYRTIFRFAGISIILTVLSAILFYGLIYFLVIGVYGISGIPRSIGILQPMILFFAIMSSRLFARYVFSNNTYDKKTKVKKNVLIYGAGNAGRQLVVALETSPEFKVVGFLDDNIELHGQVINNQKVFSPITLEKLIQLKKINLIFLALPSTGRLKRNKIIKYLNQFGLIVKTLPSISEIVDGKITVSDIKDLNIDDLLNREEVQADKELLIKNIYLKNVLVTGAGGSIGSELCRQIVKLNPNKLLLIELNEFALYEIYNELLSFNKNLKIIPLLVNVQDQKKLEIILETFKVHTIYHSAAYKHVPLVEENICEGVKNNVFSTLAITKAAVLCKVDNLVLISSDKAVRPKNIMGASKRLSEMCLQGIYNSSKNISTNFSIVRFGNVLESSGSVIPKFKKQINIGGPVTLTHKDVTRYFMTITEAAQLVIQAGAMGKYSEVFVLDMGKSVKIFDLINQMITLSGMTVKNNNNPKGDIEIQIVGLRPGEKLYEELLIGDNPQKTNHTKILKIEDPFTPFEKLEKDLNNLKILLDENKADEVKNLLQKLFNSLKSNTQIVDHIHLEKILSNN